MFNKKTNETKRENNVEFITLRNKELTLIKTYKFDLSEFYSRVIYSLFEVVETETNRRNFKDCVYYHFEHEIREEIDLVFYKICPKDLEFYCDECNAERNGRISILCGGIPPYCEKNHKTKRTYLTVEVFYREGDQ